MRPVEYRWVLKNSVKFLILIVASLLLQAWIPATIFILILTILIIAQQHLTLTFSDQDLIYDDFFLIFRTIKVPYSKLTRLFLRQSPLDKALNLNVLIIEFNDPALAKRVRLFGLYQSPGFDIGRWGNNLFIPGLTDQTASSIISTLRQKAPHLSDPKLISYGMPHYETAAKVGLYSFILYLCLALLLAIAFIFLYFYISLKSGA